MQAFVNSQVASARSGASHGGQAQLNLPQRLIIAVSSLFYLACARTWLDHGFNKLGLLFVAVTTLSLASDSCLEPIAPSTLPLCRTADRTVGSVALIASTLLNFTSILNAVLSVTAVSSAVYCLARARAAAAATPGNRWPWVRWHFTWHAWGAFVLCMVTRVAHAGPG